jgi:hypothetical protein
MRYFRHAPLTFWVAVTLALTATIAAAWFAGRDTSTAIISRNATIDVRTDVQAMLERVSGVYPAITTLDLGVWAEETAALADAGHSRHIAAGGASDDATGAAWLAVAVEARTLATEGPTDPSAALAGAARLGSATQRLVALSDGLTIPTTTSLPLNTAPAGDKPAPPTPGPSKGTGDRAPTSPTSPTSPTAPSDQTTTTKQGASS